MLLTKRQKKPFRSHSCESFDIYPFNLTSIHIFILHSFLFSGPNRVMFKLELWLRAGTSEVADKIRSKMLDALSDNEFSKPNSRTKMPDFDYRRRK